MPMVNSGLEGVITLLLRLAIPMTGKSSTDSPDNRPSRLESTATPNTYSAQRGLTKDNGVNLRSLTQDC